MARRSRIFLLLLSLSACHAAGAKYPWGEPAAPVTDTARDVRTLNDYQRVRSQVWVREVSKPTRANLDYAAYHANFMIADPEPETPIPAGKLDTSHPFKGLIDATTLTSDIGKTPLTAEERAQPMAFAPLSEFLQAHKVRGAEGLADVAAAVRGEKWGLQLPPGVSGQQLSEVYLHQVASGPAELWAKIEFSPWFKPASDVPDQDRDGYPELYGRVAPGSFTEELASAIRQDYQTPVLGPAEIKAWANQLSSYWYPSFNTDLVPATGSWPDAQTEPNIKQELSGRTFASPAIVMRGKPLGKPTYNVFLIGGESAAKGESAPAKPALVLAKTKPTPSPAPVLEAIQRELQTQGGGAWTKWEAQLSPFHQALRKRVKAMPAKVKAVAGNDGFLFYRNGLDYVAGGDLEKQRKGKNPLPVIVEFKQELDKLGVDFLFVPVPDKLEIYPEKFDADFKSLGGQVVNPYGRKLIASLAEKGVEVVDLLPAFLHARNSDDKGSEAYLYQHQDTHWTDRGLRLAAELLSTRIKRYPWYAELSRHKRTFEQRETSFSRFGDLQSRLPEAEQKGYAPENLLAHQVIGPDKQPYDDDPESPVVMLGDSFTGVYELTDAEHAGVSAHVARGISYPLDLVMSYGGGPNVRQKLLRRGEQALGAKKLVIWLMTARDLYNYWEDWEPLKKP